jgi:outer membrane immunogenic protein
MSLKNRLLVSVAAGALAGVTPGLAADMAVKAPPSVPAPVYSWTGWYVGGNVGYSWGRGQPTVTQPLPPFVGLPALNYGQGDLDGVIGGVELGYDYQFSSSWVGGFEADFQWADERNSGSFSDPYSTDCEGFCSVTGTISSKIQWFGTVRASLGWLLNPTTMVYATGGYAYGKVSIDGSVTNMQSFAGAIPNFVVPFSSSSINSGWTAGAGVKGVVPNANNLIWKVEYLYVDLGTLGGNTIAPVFFSPVIWNAKFTDNILRVGLDWNFH